MKLSDTHSVNVHWSESILSLPNDHLRLDMQRLIVTGISVRAECMIRNNDWINLLVLESESVIAGQTCCVWSVLIAPTEDLKLN